MKCLAVFYSLSGKTKALAEHAAQLLSAELAEIHCNKYGRGFFSFFRAAIDSSKGKLPPIEVSGPSPDRYDFVLLLAPVWAGHAATPLRAYLNQCRGQLKRAAFVLTCGGSCPPSAFDELAAIVGVKPQAQLILRDKDRKGGSYVSPELDKFLSPLKAQQAA
ncbi:MAG TPA: hypothetical protein VEH07_00945 [Alphaproteobacteria bacterium]|nr:hypothetical protein [Alphaproteobacteria bacterium]